MLVLTRKLNESIFIKLGDQEIKIQVLMIKKGNESEGSIRLGFEASSDIKIFRSELFESQPKM